MLFLPGVASNRVGSLTKPNTDLQTKLLKLSQGCQENKFVYCEADTGKRKLLLEVVLHTVQDVLDTLGMIRYQSVGHGGC